MDAMKALLINYDETHIFDIGYAVKNPCWLYDPREIISLENGIFNWKTGELHPWTPKIYTTIQLPVNYDPKAECPHWLKALDDWLNNPETISFLQEFIGLCLIPDTSFEVAVFLFGSGANGKSMFLETVRSLFGSSLVSIPLHRLTNRFETVYLQNKLVNICGDIDNKYITDTGVLKAMISGDELRGEIKHGKSYDFTSVCRFLFSANTVPSVSDKTFGWLRKWKFVEFPNTFPVNPAYKIQYTGLFEQEKSGILNWAIKGLQRLKAQNKWTFSRDMSNAEVEYRQQNDNVAAFVDNCIDKVPYDNTVKTLLINKVLDKVYLDWVEENMTGIQPVSLSEFSRRIVGFGYKKTTRSVDSRGYNVFLGMKIKPEFKINYDMWYNALKQKG